MARAARDLGHDVAFASGADSRRTVEEAGFRFFPAGLTTAQTSQQGHERYPGWSWGADLEHVYSLIFAGVAGAPMAGDLKRVADSFGPDVVISEVAEFGGPVAAAEASLPWAAVGWGIPIPADVAHAAGREAAPIWEEHGLRPRPYGGLYDHLYLDPCPASLAPGDGPAMRHVQPVRPTTPDGPDPAPRMLDELPHRPTVCVTLGTSTSWAGLISQVTRAVIAGLGDQDFNVVITGGDDQTAMGNVPSNVHVAKFIPLGKLLPRCDVVVSYAGSGTMLAALDHGLPHLALPMGADQFRNADAIVRVGAGMQLMPGDLSAASLRAHVASLLGTQTFRAAAEAVMHEMAAMPGPVAAIRTLKSLQGGDRSHGQAREGEAGQKREDRGVRDR